MKKTIYLLLLILGTSSLSLLRASDESTNAISNKDIEIRIASNAVSVQSDTNATVLPSKEEFVV
jgi:hypothetical protein